MKKAFVGAFALVVCAGLASADDVLITGFESGEGYNAGFLSGQNGWVEVDGTTGVPTTNFSIINNAANAHAGSQYVETNTLNWASGTSRFSWANTPLSGAQLAVRPLVDTSVQVRVSTPIGSRVSGAGMFLFGTTATPGDASLAGMRLLTSGALQLFNGANAGIAFPANTGLLNSYHEMRMVCNYSTQSVDFFFDGQYLNPLLGAFSTAFSAIGYNDADIYGVRGSTGAGGATLRYDDLSVRNLVPAPGAFALLGLGGLVAGRRRR